MDKAKDLLSSYFETAFRAAGLTWTSDNQAEAESIIQLIFDEVKHSILSKRI